MAFAAATSTAQVPWLWPAVISASAGLLGVVVGGGITAYLDGKRRAAEDARQSRHEALVARASARLEQERLRFVRAVVGAAIDQGNWPPDSVQPPPPLPIEDYRILAQYLTESEMDAVSTARLTATIFFQHRDIVEEALGSMARFESMANLPGLEGDIVTDLKADADVLDWARNRLSRLAADPT